VTALASEPGSISGVTPSNAEAVLPMAVKTNPAPTTIKPARRVVERNSFTDRMAFLLHSLKNIGVQNPSTIAPDR
jgi:hypothetical protein